MTSRAPQPMPEGTNRANRPKAPDAPRSPTNMNIEEAKQTLFEHEARMENIDKELKALREEMRKDLEMFNKVAWRVKQ